MLGTCSTVHSLVGLLTSDSVVNRLVRFSSPGESRFVGSQSEVVYCTGACEPTLPSALSPLDDLIAFHPTRRSEIPHCTLF